MPETKPIQNQTLTYFIVLKKPVSQVQEIYNMSDLRVKILLEHDQLVSIIPIAQQDFQTKDIAYLRNIRREGIEL